MSYRDAVMAAKYAGGSNEQATALHEHRLETVVGGEGYFGFDAPRGLVVHVVPDAVYDDGYAIDLAEHSILPEANPSRPTQLPVLGNHDAHGTWTADGFAASVERESDDEREAACAGYSHLFSNGVIEAVSAIPFGEAGVENEPERSEPKQFDGRALELDLTRCVRRYLRVLAYHQQMSPIHVTLTMYGVRGCLLDSSESESTDAGRISENMLAPFPVNLSNFDADVRTELANPIDALWRGAGYPGSPFFDSGEWTLRSAFDGQ
ncbi:hypothetical protein SAMN05421858_0646 [Haladaptatus litoreus]|uniref:Uncharacterized protein n=1 Tax=Haladaptatus litoreus TaxID=553468 RepID=A0A1N6W9M4_9EURY|nr:hypothetical protein [Haladaptatus litoreus]SIQ86784.1 hypothetical protein SAMN05421858_0646 [Haladaptatus litoreus]